MRNHGMTKVVERAKFEQWVEAVGGSVRWPYNRANFWVDFKVTECEGISASLNVTALSAKPGRSGGTAFFYGRERDWTHVEVCTDAGPAFNLYGKGSRASSVYWLMCDYLGLLTEE